MVRVSLIACVLLLSASTAGAEAASPSAAAYGLIVGSNQGGPGQQPLRYAEQDAQRVAELLASLGGYPAERITTLLAPSSAQLDSALAALDAELQAHAADGEPTRFFFYYSGHARADALNLGAEQVALASLKQRIVKLPATLSIAVLDACQSGAFARAKGAGRAADFSFNTVEQLHTEGVAVMASSSGEELSQESEELQSGHFTHHLVVGLRGAGDSNADGAVTLSEAYSYAYNRTLATTAVTTIGEQHVMLENALTGHGDVALTRPADADAHLLVPPSVSGRVLVQRMPSLSVVADLDKAGRDSVRLALPAGQYQAILRKPSVAWRCRFALTRGAITDLSRTRCEVVPLVEAVAKGAERAPQAEPTRKLAPAENEGFFIELALGGTHYAREGAYQDRLHAFGFQRNSDVTGFDVELSVGRRFLPNLAVGANLFDLDASIYERNITVAQRFEYSAYSAGAWVQGDYAFGHNRLFNVFVRGGLGLAVASTSFDALKVLAQNADESELELAAGGLERVEETKTDAAFSLSVGASASPLRNLGLLLYGRYTYAPILDNGLGDSHDVGGLSLMLGLRFRTMEKP